MRFQEKLDIALSIACVVGLIVAGVIALRGLVAYGDILNRLFIVGR